MPGDLEDFLKRAAERRAQKQGGGAAPKPKTRQRAEYTDARRERQVRQPVVEEAIPVAEIVEPVNPLAEQQRKLEQAKAKAAAAKQRLKSQQKKASTSTDAKAKDLPPVTALNGTPAENLIAMIRQPGGIQQAFLLREILERPSDRW